MLGERFGILISPNNFFLAVRFVINLQHFYVSFFFCLGANNLRTYYPMLRRIDAFVFVFHPMALCVQCFSVLFVSMPTGLTYVCLRLSYTFDNQEPWKLASVIPSMLPKQAICSHEHPKKLAACSLLLPRRQVTSTFCLLRV